MAGGVPAGLGPWQTLIKEAGEEASIPPALAAEASEVGVILQYSMERAGGLRRDCCLATTWSCRPISSRWPRTARWKRSNSGRSNWWPKRCARTDEFKFNVNLVLIDLFIRRGLISGSAARSLSSALRTGHPRHRGEPTAKRWSCNRPVAGDDPATRPVAGDRCRPGETWSPRQRPLAGLAETPSVPAERRPNGATAAVSRYRRRIVDPVVPSAWYQPSGGAAAMGISRASGWSPMPGAR